MFSFKNLVYLLIILQVLDIVTTFYGIKTGVAVEANFFLRSFKMIIFIKLVMLALIVSIYYFFQHNFTNPEKKIFRYTFLVFSIFYSFILINNIVVIVSSSSLVK